MSKKLVLNDLKVTSFKITKENEKNIYGGWPSIVNYNGNITCPSVLKEK